MPLTINGTPTSPLSVTIYGTLNDANDYFANKLFVETWDDASDLDKVKALNMATQAIDNLDYEGVKLDSSQDLEFPRDSFVVIPTAIVRACYECAFEFLDGVDIEEEIKSLRITSETFAAMKEMTDKNTIPDHLVAGIPSAIAWSYLRPYLKVGAGVQMKRVS